MVDRKGRGARGRLHTLPDPQRSACIYQPILLSVATRFVCVGGVWTCFTVASGKL
jgi:hypothetical protein